MTGRRPPCSRCTVFFGHVEITQVTHILYCTLAFQLPLKELSTINHTAFAIKTLND